MPGLKEFKDKIKMLDILEVLEQVGVVSPDEVHNRKIVCPFHDDKNPSLSFYEDSFYCFGCGATGDVFSYIEKMYSFGFVQSILFVAEKLGQEVEVDKDLSFKKTVQPSVLEKQWEEYKKNIKLFPTLAKQTRQFFPLEVGYDLDKKYFVFKYTSKTGEILGFTKRRAFESTDSRYPKWVHSSIENSNISLCANIFNLGDAIKYIRKKDHVILVEGPKDIIPWILTNHKEVVATSGCKNEAHIFDILPRTSRITLSYDSDDAGRKGMIGLVCLLSQTRELSDIDCYFFDGKDPYDYYQENKKVPEKSHSVFDLFQTDVELRNLYGNASFYNKGQVLRYVAEKKNISVEEAKSFFDMDTTAIQYKKIKQDNEKSRLVRSQDENSLRKLQLKYGIV